MHEAATELAVTHPVEEPAKVLAIVDMGAEPGVITNVSEDGVVSVFRKDQDGPGEMTEREFERQCVRLASQRAKTEQRAVNEQIKMRQKVDMQQRKNRVSNAPDKQTARNIRAHNQAVKAAETKRKEARAQVIEELRREKRARIESSKANRKQALPTPPDAQPDTQAEPQEPQEFGKVGKTDLHDAGSAGGDGDASGGARDETQSEPPTEPEEQASLPPAPRKPTARPSLTDGAVDLERKDVALHGTITSSLRFIRALDDDVDMSKPMQAAVWRRMQRRQHRCGRMEPVCDTLTWPAGTARRTHCRACALMP